LSLDRRQSSRAGRNSPERVFREWLDVLASLDAFRFPAKSLDGETTHDLCWPSSDDLRCHVSNLAI
jgi:hypothetical protein